MTIVGAGISGLIAALRLLQRGFRVMLIERDDFIGGQWHSFRHDDDEDFHEHSFHFFQNWYHNFWCLTSELGLQDNFEPRTTIKFLRKGEFPYMSSLVNNGAPRSALGNLFSGIEPAADIFSFAYSAIDLLSHPIDRSDFLDRFSVNGFMHGRDYATERGAEMHNRLLNRAFAVPSYNTSASSYRTYLRYTMRHPEPSAWILKGNSYENYLVYLERALRSFGARFIYCPLLIVKKIHLEEGRCGTLTAFLVTESKTRAGALGLPFVETPPPHSLSNVVTIPVNGDIIFTVPPVAMSELVDEPVYRADQRLGYIRKLRSEPLASIDLHFKTKIPWMPRDHVALYDSRYDMTFLDHSQYWPDQSTTFLNVVASQPEPILFPAELGQADTREQLTQAMGYVIDELCRYIPIDPRDIDYERSQFHPNSGDELFVNDVGSWQYRPTTVTGISNMFMAGDYCRNFIDVASIEGAIVSGLMAAETVRRRAGVGAPIRIIRPASYPDVMFSGLRMMLAPYAYAAKAWSTGYDALRRGATRRHPHD